MKVSWFPRELLRAEGELGLTHLPGGFIHSSGENLNALQQVGVTHLVCLVEEHELERLEPPESSEMRQWAVERRGMQFLHEPIVDFDAPTLEQIHGTLAFVEQGLGAGGRVIVHCWAGLGRAGTMAACLLIKRGMNAHDAIATVRYVRRGAIQSVPQVQMIKLFASSLGRS